MSEVDQTDARGPGEDPLGGALAGIAKRHKELRDQKTLALIVPGYEDMMKVEYKLLPETEMDSLDKRIEAIKDEGVTGNWETEADMLVSLCNRILLQAEPGSGWVVLEDEDGPIRFGAKFAKVMEAVGVKVASGRARESVIDFFCPRSDPENPSSPRQFPNAMDRHINAIQLWNRGLTDQIAKNLLGE